MSGSDVYVGRLAPSPTGALHLGNVRTFLIAWLRARSQGGKVLFRMEDLDHPKDKPGAAAQAVEDLVWLGFDWDGECVQSERKPLYRSALAFLRSRGLAYPCACTRRDVEAAQSAPHAGEQLRYPGTCRGRFASWSEACAAKSAALRRPRSEVEAETRWRSEVEVESGTVNFRSPPQASTSTCTPCWRFRVPDGAAVRFVDSFAGPYEQDVTATLGDFPLARDEGGAGYTLACAVDDLLTGVTEVVRGDDLLPATPAQILLMRALAPWTQRLGVHAGDCGRIGDAPLPVNAVRTRPADDIPPSIPLPSYLHVPLVVGPDGRRLAKRHGDTRVAAFREAGRRPEEILGALAATCGWAAKGERVTLRELIERFDLSTIPHEPAVMTNV